MADLVFAVRRGDTELVRPAAPTPRETKRMSDIDDQFTLRLNMSIAFFYRGGEDGSVALRDPAAVIRRALSQALVHYYPLAGRLREVEGNKAVVDCTGEGVLFIEAEADVRLAELRAAGLTPPFPCMEQLIVEVEGSLERFTNMFGTPMMLVQVTRLLCGGFVVAIRHSHIISDAAGMAQFLHAVAELARGRSAPTVTPAWSRELLEVPSHLRPSSTPSELVVAPPQAPLPDMAARSFTFSLSEIAAIKKRLPPPLRDTATSFEVLSSFLWRARTAALEVPLDEYAPLAVVTNLRDISELGLPAGYYGNASFHSTALAGAATLRHGSLADAVERVRKAKALMTADYVHSTLADMVLGGQPSMLVPSLFLISDLRSVGFHHVDFGWGKPLFAGSVYPIFGVSFLTTCKDPNGEDAVNVSVVLPPLAMELFAAEKESLLVSKTSTE